MRGTARRGYLHMTQQAGRRLCSTTATPDLAAGQLQYTQAASQAAGVLWEPAACGMGGEGRHGWEESRACKRVA